MNRLPDLRRPLLVHIPAPARRMFGIMLLTLTLWLSGIMALFH